jgi:aryl-alcohol dehydrogenase
MIPAKTVRGIVEGDAVPDIFIPRLIDLHAKGRFPFDRLVKFYDLDRINEAADDAEEGNTLKPVLRLGLSSGRQRCRSTLVDRSWYGERFVTQQ